MEHSPPLQVREPYLNHLSFCGSTVNGLNDWLTDLPKANLGETARRLCQALIELNRLRTTAETRLAMLELLRPEIHDTIRNLERYFLRQSVAQDEQSLKIAAFCQTLQTYLSTGYKLIIRSTAGATDRKQRHLLTTALQRSLNSTSNILQRAAQLYRPGPKGLWLECHQLYQLALHKNLHKKVVRDPLTRHTIGLSTEQVYLSALLLSTARCNQLQQNTIAHLAETLELWAPLAELQNGREFNNLFTVMPGQDKPPRYQALSLKQAPQELLGFNPGKLVTAINHYLQRPEQTRDKSSLFVPPQMTPRLLQHLATAWSDMSARTDQRIPKQGKLTLCVGVTAIHYFLADRQPFSEILKTADIPSGPAIFESIPRIPRRAEGIWQNTLGHDPIEYKPTPAQPQLDVIEYVSPKETASPPTAQEQEATPKYPCHSVSVLDTSAKGYCLHWPDQAPSRLQNGELLGIREPDSNKWRLAIVRWLRQGADDTTRIGAEILSSQALPCGVRQVRDSSQNSHIHYQRAFLLPAVDPTAHPATLIVPKLSFQEGHEVLLNRQGQTSRAQLGKPLTMTESFCQFEYQQMIGKTASSLPDNALDSRESFDSPWKSL